MYVRLAGALPLALACLAWLTPARASAWQEAHQTGNDTRVRVEPNGAASIVLQLRWHLVHGPLRYVDVVGIDPAAVLDPEVRVSTDDGRELSARAARRDDRTIRIDIDDPRPLLRGDFAFELRLQVGSRSRHGRSSGRERRWQLVWSAPVAADGFDAARDGARPSRRARSAAAHRRRNRGHRRERAGVPPARPSARRARARALARGAGRGRCVERSPRPPRHDAGPRPAPAPSSQIYPRANPTAFARPRFWSGCSRWRPRSGSSSPTRDARSEPPAPHARPVRARSFRCPTGRAPRWPAQPWRRVSRSSWPTRTAPGPRALRSRRWRPRGVRRRASRCPADPAGGSRCGRRTPSRQPGGRGRGRRYLTGWTSAPAPGAARRSSRQRFVAAAVLAAGRLGGADPWLIALDAAPLFPLFTTGTSAQLAPHGARSAASWMASVFRRLRSTDTLRVAPWARVAEQPARPGRAAPPGAAARGDARPGRRRDRPRLERHSPAAGPHGRRCSPVCSTVPPRPRSSPPSCPRFAWSPAGAPTNASLS